jgi:hypothetical protein
LQRLKVALDGVHRPDDGSAEARSLGELEQFVVASFFGEQQSATLKEIAFHQRTFWHFTSGLLGCDLSRSSVKAVGGMPQKDNAQHWHAVFRRRQLGVRAEIIHRRPKVGFQLLDAVLGILRHAFFLIRHFRWMQFSIGPLFADAFTSLAAFFSSLSRSVRLNKR